MLARLVLGPQPPVAIGSLLAHFRQGFGELINFILRRLSFVTRSAQLVGQSLAIDIKTSELPTQFGVIHRHRGDEFSNRFACIGRKVSQSVEFLADSTKVFLAALGGL